MTDDIPQNISEFEKFESNAGKKLTTFLSDLEPLYRVISDHLLYEDIHSLGLWLRFKNWHSLFTVFLKARLWESWQKVLDKRFHNPLMKQILGFSSVFLGGSPFNTPSFYSMLVWADFKGGVWYPKGGMSRVIKGLETLCRDNQVRILTNSEVEHIEVIDGKITGVRTNNSFYPAQIVVGATDLHWLETKLLSPSYQTYSKPYWEKKTLGISCLLLYLGAATRYPTLAHHNFYFTKDWKKNFEEIFDKKILPSDPSFYITVRTVTDRTIAPKNTEELVILVPLPSREYSENELSGFTDTIITTIEQKLQISLRQHILVKEVFTPHDFEKDYHAYHGAALGLAHTFWQSLWFRPNNVSRKVKGLYYAGQYTNPGVGVPMALVSARLVSKLIGFAPSLSQWIFKNGSITYYYSSLFFRGQTKFDVFTLYAYVRTIDDFVDRIDPQIEALDIVWKATKDAWKGKFVDNQIVRHFVELAKRKHFEWEWIESFWYAMRSDLQNGEYHTFEELEHYMYGSAEVIGFMMSRVLDLPPAAMRTAAIQGKAMQLLNFIRDVQEDELLGRTYLQYDKKSKSDPRKWKIVVKRYLNKYYQFQKEAEEGYIYLPKKYLIPIKTAANMFKKTAHIIEQNPMIVWERKVKPTKWQVLFELLQNAVL
jgi:phytoene desaturase